MATATLVAALDDHATTTAVLAERAFLRALEGGCQVPIGAVAHLEGDDVVLDGFVASLDGAAYLRSSGRGPASDPEGVGQALANELLRQGADDILRQVRQAAAIEPPAAP